LTGFKITYAIELEDAEPPILSDLSYEIENYGPICILDRLFEALDSQCNTSFLLIHGLTTYLIGAELTQSLIDALMRWTLGRQPTPIPIERDMHDVIALALGFPDNLASTREFDPDLNYPVYISEPLVFLSLGSFFEKKSRTTRQRWIAQSFRNARNESSLGFVFEDAALSSVLMEVHGGKFNPLADVFRCSEELLGSRRVTLVSLKRGSDGEMQSSPVSWNAGSSDRFGLKAGSPDDILAFLDNPDGMFSLQDEETQELILVALQAKVSKIDAPTWQAAVISVTPQFFYTMVVCIKPCNPRQTQPLLESL